ncbi:Protein of unknown function [Pyronema omphalodes CBS 100304]|uniref:Uncharacterized protein n=1 Tax=Pyronema omphalodes (strain CBS 100304) TaxID=1076935 RepID=U4L3F2_PYROM|nr:Protein of unknown function [Pyronema omphalodes CBS 100304]
MLQEHAPHTPQHNTE